MVIKARAIPALLLLCATAVGVSACGSSSSHSNASTSPAAFTSTSQASGAEIKLGMICSCSGPQAGSLGATSTVIEAWARHVNASGGIGGHPVQVTIKDDGQNPATSLQDAKELVEQDHVMAIVGESSLVDTAWESYIAKAGVPVVGGISPESPFLTNPDFYPSGAQLVAQTFGTIALAKQAGRTHIGVMYCAESPICAQVVPLTQGFAQLSAMKFSASKIAATAPSYAAPCLASKQAGIDALFVADASAVVERVIAGCAQQGYKPLQVSQITTATNGWLSNPAFDGTLLSGVNANPFDPSTPSIQLFQTEMNKYAPGLVNGSGFSYDAILPWSGGLLFQAAAAAAKLTPTSTPADVKKGLYALKDETLGGLAPPLTFTPGRPSFVPCYFTEKVTNGKFASLNANKPTCLTATQAKAIVASLSKLTG